jgi:hypothetical protein
MQAVEGGHIATGGGPEHACQRGRMHYDSLSEKTTHLTENRRISF